jgi:hypothetical protein
VDAEQSAGDAAPPAWVVDLVKSADPVSVGPTQMRRMLLRAGHGEQQRRSAWLRPIVVGAFLLGGTAAASAAFTNWPANLVRACRALVARPQSTGAAPSKTAGRPAIVAAPQHTDDAVMNEAIPAPAEPGMPAPILRHTGASGHVHSRTHVEPQEDPSLVVEATKALRAEHDARRARVLARRYLREHPGGALAEEAMAIVVEAALEQHDPDAQNLAAVYLTLYPDGSFRAAIERALSAR